MEEAIEVLETESGRRSHVCTICGEAFSEDDMLKVRMADGNWDWVCADCACEWERDTSCDVGLFLCDDCKEFYMVCLSSLEDCERGIHVCGECRDENWCECASCGKWFRLDGMRKAEELYDDGSNTGNTVSLCEECFREEACRCVSCSEWFWPKDNMPSHDGSVYCGDCFDEQFECCDRCGDYEPRDDMRTVHVSYRNEERWCDHCVENHAFTCDGCGETFCDDNYHCYGEGYESYCEDCWDQMDHYDEDEENDSIHSYGYKPSPEFHGTQADNEPFMGVELECGGANYSDRDCAAAMLADDVSGDLLYLKEDGSITYAGFEMVTHPCTLKFHEEEFPWASILETCRTHGLRSHDLKEPHGLHVHLTRGALDERLWRLLDAFVNNNEVEMTKLARRKGNSYCKYNSQENVAPGYSCDRYRAVNFQNSHTIELRLFRGSLIENTVLATLEIAHSFWDVLHRHGEDYLRMIPQEYQSGHRAGMEYATASRLMLEDWTDMMCEEPRYARALQYMRSRGAFSGFFGEDVRNEKREDAAE